MLFSQDVTKATPRLFDLLRDNGVFGVGVWKGMLVQVQVQASGDPRPGHIKTLNTDLVDEVQSDHISLRLTHCSRAVVVTRLRVAAWPFTPTRSEMNRSTSTGTTDRYARGKGSHTPGAGIASYLQDYLLEYERFLGLGVEAFFTDFPQSLRNFFKTKMRPRSSKQPDSSSAGPATHQAVAKAFLVTIVCIFIVFV